jgi:glycosyltransferase involved in cell wall biosynthesis
MDIDESGHSPSRERRLNILVCAYACSPFHGSEEGVGWNIVSRLGKYCTVTVLYGDCDGKGKRRDDLHRWFEANGLVADVDFCYVDPSKFGKFLLSVAHYGMKLFPPLVFIYYLSYRSWLRQAYKTALLLHREHPFDVAHQLTYISYREPGYLWKLSIPFVWGPIAGAVNLPWRFFTCLSAAGMVRFAFRNCFNFLQKRGSRYVRNAADSCSKLWVVGGDEYYMARKLWGAYPELMPETGTAPQKTNKDRRIYSPISKLTLLWSGTHETGKALPLLLRALALIEDQSRLNVIILGDGPERRRWSSMANRLRIASMLEWKGQLAHTEAKAVMRHADVFVFTSLKEATSTVVMEALSYGLPVICHDACGMAQVIDESCGLKIPLKSPRHSIRGFHAAIQSLMNDSTLLEALSTGAEARAIKFSWDNKAKRIFKTYRQLVSKLQRQSIVVREM